jgi:hypothetical protein
MDGGTMSGDDRYENDYIVPAQCYGVMTMNVFEQNCDCFSMEIKNLSIRSFFVAKLTSTLN